jgi:hypothetical protein
MNIKGDVQLVSRRVIFTMKAERHYICPLPFDLTSRTLKVAVEFFVSENPAHAT